MKKVIFTMISMLTLGNAVFAQNWMNDSISMGAGTTNDVFYRMNNMGSLKTENNKNWHLAFSLNGGDSAAIWANHNSGLSFVKAYNIHKDNSQWASVTLADTASAMLMFNNDQEWSQGALNAIQSPSPFNFGWGTYDVTTHNILGDSIFIIKANGNFYKLFIDSLTIMGNYYFRVGDFSGNTINHSIMKSNFPNRRFAYYNLATDADTNREPDNTTWDILFTKYSTNDPLSGPNPFNSVLGVLSNKGVQCVRANAVHVDTAIANYYATYDAQLNKIISTIGYNWKVFDQSTFTYSVPDSNSYFVKDLSGAIYQLQFLQYSGSAAGNINFRKRMLTPLNVQDVNSSINQYSLYPVPAQQEVNLVLDSKISSAATVLVYDVLGHVVLTSTLSIQTGLNAFQLPMQHLENGNYIVSIQGKNINISSKIQVQK